MKCSLSWSQQSRRASVPLEFIRHKAESLQLHTMHCMTTWNCAAQAHVEKQEGHFLCLKDIQARPERHAGMDVVLLCFSSFTWPQCWFWHCTPQCGISRSRTAPASLLRELFPLGKLWVFPQGQFGCILPATPEMSMLTPKDRKGDLCLMITVLSMPRSSIAKQQGNGLFL